MDTSAASCLELGLISLTIQNKYCLHLLFIAGVRGKPLTCILLVSRLLTLALGAQRIQSILILMKMLAAVHVSILSAFYRLLIQEHCGMNMVWSLNLL
jgi:hypothetical protein